MATGPRSERPARPGARAPRSTYQQPTNAPRDPPSLPHRLSRGAELRLEDPLVRGAVGQPVAVDLERQRVRAVARRGRAGQRPPTIPSWPQTVRPQDRSRAMSPSPYRKCWPVSTVVNISRVCCFGSSLPRVRARKQVFRSAPVLIISPVAHPTGIAVPAKATLARLEPATDHRATRHGGRDTTLGGRGHGAVSDARHADMDGRGRGAGRGHRSAVVGGRRAAVGGRRAALAARSLLVTRAVAPSPRSAAPRGRLVVGSPRVATGRVHPDTPLLRPGLPAPAGPSPRPRSRPPYPPPVHPLCRG